MIIKWVTGRYGDLIKRTECDRETEKSVFITSEYFGKFRQNRIAKRSNYENFFDTWEEAKEYLLKRSDQHVLGITRSLNTEKGRNGNIKGLKKPTED